MPYQERVEELVERTEELVEALHLEQKARGQLPAHLERVMEPSMQEAEEAVHQVDLDVQVELEVQAAAELEEQGPDQELMLLSIQEAVEAAVEADGQAIPILGAVEPAE